jgi:tRNA A58 N-methylase Trm61
MLPAPLIPPAILGSTLPGVLAALSLREQLGIFGLVVGLLLSIGSLVGVFYGVKWKTSAEAEHSAFIAVKELADAQEARLAVSQAVAAEYRQKLDDRDALVVDMRKKLADAEALPDMSKLLKEIHSHDTAAKKRDLSTARAVRATTEALEHLAAHEVTAQEQTEQTSKAIEAMLRFATELEGHCPYLGGKEQAGGSRAS